MERFAESVRLYGSYWELDSACHAAGQLSTEAADTAQTAGGKGYAPVAKPQRKSLGSFLVVAATLAAIASACRVCAGREREKRGH